MDKSTGSFHGVRRGRKWRLTPRSLAVWLCGAALVAGSGCTTVRTLDTPVPQQAWADAQPGDSVSLTLRDGRTLDMELVEWTGQALIGRDSSGTTVTVPHADIEQVRAERISVGRTALLGLTIGTLVALATLDFALPLSATPEY